MDWNDDLFVDARLPVAGMVKAPEDPGHGVAFKPELVRDCRVGGREIPPEPV